MTHMTEDEWQPTPEQLHLVEIGEQALVSDPDYFAEVIARMTSARWAALHGEDDAHYDHG